MTLFSQIKKPKKLNKIKKFLINQIQIIIILKFLEDKIFIIN